MQGFWLSHSKGRKNLITRICETKNTTNCVAKKMKEATLALENRRIG